jgi:hypothetical protein
MASKETTSSACATRAHNGKCATEPAQASDVIVMLVADENSLDVPKRSIKSVQTPFDLSTPHATVN